MEIFAHPQPHKTKTLLESCGLPISDLDLKKFENFLYVGTFDSPIGIIGLEIFNSVALLRSLAVSKEARGKGYAKLLVSSIENLAKSKNIKELYLLTETAEAFFKKLDYCSIQKELAPESIKNTSEYSSVCPQSAVLMNKQLKG
jgi:amino-acid N-acetyltransferase